MKISGLILRHNRVRVKKKKKCQKTAGTQPKRKTRIDKCNTRREAGV